MNSMKAFVAIVATLVVVTGCQKQEEEQVSLPPDQILAGNAILAPQQPDTVNLAQTVSTPAALNAPAPATPVALPEPTTLELSSSIPEKPTDKEIQQALKNAGLYDGPLDGNIGPKSKRAIRLFQEQNGLAADGKVGPRTWKKLSSYLNSAPAEDAASAEISN